MEIKRISLGQMPPADKYILVYVQNRPWSDATDPTGVFWRIAKCIYDVAEYEFDRKPYYFAGRSAGEYRASEVDMWCELPTVEVKE